jgi:hypothetical protein
MLVAKAHADEILRPLAREWARQQQLPEAKRHILLVMPEMVLFLSAPLGTGGPDADCSATAGLEYGYKPTGVLASLHKFGSLVSECRKQASETPSLAA